MIYFVQYKSQYHLKTTMKNLGFFFCSSLVKQGQSVTNFHLRNSLSDLQIIVETWILLYKHICPGNETLRT